MAIIINGKSYSGSLTSQILTEMINAINTLPKPEVIPVEKSNLALENMMLCLQREMVYIDEFNPNNPIQYIGSKNVYSCIVLYVRSETDHLVIHVDGTEPLDLTEQIGYFNYKANLSVTLIGGVAGVTSEKNLRQILLALNTAAQKLNIEITINSQNLIQNNYFTEEDEYDFIYDKYFEKMSIVACQFFGKTLDKQQFADRTKQDFKTRSVKGKVDHQMLMMLAGVFAQLAEIYDIRANNDIREAIFTGFKQRVTSIEEFIKLADLMFSIEGFNIYSMAFRVNKLFPEASLSSFVFDLHSPRVYKISSHTETPDELKRSMRLVDSFQDKCYHMFYNGRLNQLLPPALSSELITRCRFLEAQVRNNSINPELYKDKLGITDLAIQKIVARFIKTLTPSSSVTLAASIVFFDPKYSPRYLRKNIELTQKLEELIRLSGVSFTVSQRDFPEFTIDAIYDCDLEEESLKIQSELQNQGIISVIGKSSEGKYRITVPAINVGHYAEAICARSLKIL